MAKTGTLPGFEGEVIQPIIDAAKDYEKLRNKRMKILTEEVDANDRLVELMKEHKLKTYDGPDGMRIELAKPSGKVKAKVKRVSDEEEAAVPCALRLRRSDDRCSVGHIPRRGRGSLNARARD